MIEAYGGVFEGKGSNPDELSILWRRSTKLTGAKYHLPGGSVGRRFVDNLTKEVTRLCDSTTTEKRSELVLLLESLILHKEKTSPKAKIFED